MGTLYVLFPQLFPGLPGFSSCEYILMPNGSLVFKVIFMPPKYKPISVLHLIYKQRKILPKKILRSDFEHTKILPYLLPKSSMSIPSIILYPKSSCD